MFSLKDNFILLVQTGAIVRDIQSQRQLAVSIVARAMQIEDRKIDDAWVREVDLNDGIEGDVLAKMVKDYLDYQGNGGYKPRWL